MNRINRNYVQTWLSLCLVPNSLLRIEVLLAGRFMEKQIATYMDCLENSGSQCLRRLLEVVLETNTADWQNLVDAHDGKILLGHPRGMTSSTQGSLIGKSVPHLAHGQSCG